MRDKKAVRLALLRPASDEIPMHRRSNHSRHPTDASNIWLSMFNLHEPLTVRRLLELALFLCQLNRDSYRQASRQAIAGRRDYRRPEMRDSGSVDVPQSTPLGPRGRQGDPLLRQLLLPRRRVVSAANAACDRLGGPH